MKLHFLPLSLLGSVLGALTLNTALADEVAIHDFKTAGIVVSYHDLNLANSAEFDNLLRRVGAAADKTCGVENFRVSLDVERKNRDCVSHSIDNATAKIDDVKFTAPHQPKLVAGIIGS